MKASQEPKPFKPKTYVVPDWTKVVFFWGALAMIVGLVGYQLDKRALYRRLLVSNVMRPIVLAPKDAPAFALPKGQDGPIISLDAFGKKWVLVNFWATWCPPCREEMPSLELLHRQISEDMVVLAVSVDENWLDVQKFFAHQPPSFAVVWDKGKKLATQFGVSKFPETFLISPDRKVVVQFSGSRDWSSAESLQYFREQIAAAGERTAIQH
jgi:thiol-disulfide isomerase/thioredoxin